MYSNGDFKLYGLQFKNKDGKDLLVTESFNNDKLKKSENMRFCEIKIQKDERILGVRSSGMGLDDCSHFNF